SVSPCFWTIYIGRDDPAPTNNLWCRNISQKISGGPACARLIVWRHEIPPCISIRSARPILYDEHFRVKAKKYRVAIQARLRTNAKSLAIRPCDLHIVAECDP